MANFWESFKNIRETALISGFERDARTSIVGRDWLLNDYAWRPEFNKFQWISDIGNIPGIGGAGDAINKLTAFIDNPYAELNSTPRIVLYEFEPTPQYAVLIDIYSNVWNIFKQLLTSEPGDIVPGFFNKFKDIFSLSTLAQAVQDTTNTDFNNDVAGWVVDLPKAFYEHLIAGMFLNKFELPYYGNEFLHARGHEGWTKTTVKSELLGDGVGTLLNRFGLGGIDMPMTPRFQLVGGGPSADQLNATLYLYNDTLQNFIRNYQFLYNLCSGAFWVQSGFLQRGSNMYRVEIPGRLIYYLCTMDIKVDCVGRSRELNPLAVSNTNFKDKMPAIFHPTPTQARTLVPDGYKIEIQLQSIMPNNFNSFLYMMMDDPNFKAARFATRETLVQKILQDLATKIENIK